VGEAGEGEGVEERVVVDGDKLEEEDDEREAEEDEVEAEEEADEVEEGAVVEEGEAEVEEEEEGVSEEDRVVVDVDGEDGESAGEVERLGTEDGGLQTLRYSAKTAVRCLYSLLLSTSAPELAPAPALAPAPELESEGRSEVEAETAEAVSLLVGVGVGVAAGRRRFQEAMRVERGSLITVFACSDSVESETKKSSRAAVRIWRW
jgi:hypothetical protein